ncbi:centromere DNA-binding protein complex CBF3 subunit [Hirsutella rhossiliensis]
MSNAIEDPRVRAAIEHYLLDLENTQPKNTKRNYRPKQEEWKEWCQANWPAIPDVWPASVPQGQQLPGDLVDEGKLLLFMKEKTTPRGSGSQEGRERRRAPSDTIVVGGGGSEYESDSDLELYESTLKLQYNTIPDHTNVAWSEERDRLRPEDAGGLSAREPHAAAVRQPPADGVGRLLSLDLPNEGCKAQGRKGGKVSVFQRSEDWYETKVLRRSAKEPQAPLSGQTAREWTSRFYKKAGIKVSKVSHAPRVAATQNADMAGVDEGQIRRAGRWNNGDQMTGCYLTSLPFEFMRAVADFDPEWSGSYFVPRATAHSSPFSDLGVEQNMAAGAFLELLEWLREVLLQDAVFLRESYPDHPIFQDPVFSCPEFEAFASKVQDTCTRDHEDSHTTVIQKRCRWLRRSCAHWTSLRRRPTPSPSAPAKVLQVNMRRSRELINRGAALHERRSSEKNYFSTRKIIIDEVRRRAQSDGLTEDIVARQMDEERGGPSSLDKLFKAIRKDRQGEKGHKRASGQFNVGGSEKSMAQ